MIHLGLVMTQGVGFHEWEKTGLLDREISLYEGLEGIQTIFFHDEQKEVNYKEFKFLPKNKLSETELNLIKSNQINGAHIGLKAAQKKKIPFILRCGYSWADFQQHRAISRFDKWKARRYERKLAQAADLCVVSNISDQEMFVKNYKINNKKLCVHPNWVNTDLWIPNKRMSEKQLVISVGRLVSQKNHKRLIEALAYVKNVRLKIIGQGPLEDELTATAQQHNVDLTIQSPLSHHELVHELNEASLFVLCSDYEGLPKALLEAMALELPCVSTRIQGIERVINHKKNGLIADGNVESFSATLKEILSSQDDRLLIGKEARKTICERFSLTQARVSELRMIEECLRQ